MNEIVISIVVVAIFLVILFVLLTLTTRKINVLVKDNFMGKMQQFDYLISDKEKKLDELEKKDNAASDKTKIDNSKKEKSENGGGGIYIGTSAKLRKSDILKDYKAIKINFSHDIVEKIRKFVELNPENKSMIGRYAVLKKIKSYFSLQNIFKISAYQSEEQRKIVEEILSAEEKEIVAKMLNRKNFNVKKFVQEVDDMLRENDPMIYVYVGEKRGEYEDIDRRIVVGVDEKIVEGVKIVYRGKVFDYSI